MRLRVGGDDSLGFEATSGALLARFEEWLRARGLDGDHAAEVASDVAVALDWKWSYADGDLGWWRTDHLAEFLLEWCPRKLSASPDESRSIPAALAAFVAFLEDTGLLAHGSSPPAMLEAAAAALTEDFVAAMGDTSRFGMAKSLFGAAAADGVDLTDRAELEDWMRDFNARPLDQRRRIIPDPALGFRRPALPPVALPSDAEAAASRAAAPILAMFAAMAEYVGPGRPLTQKGNLTLADARALVELLGTGDAVDQIIGERTFKTRSSAELPVLRHVFAWARKAGVVRVAKGKVSATKRGLALASDPGTFFDRAVDALFAIGPLASQRLPDHWFAWPDVDELLDGFVVHLLVGPYAAQRPLPLEDLAAVAVDAVLDAFHFPSLGDDDVARRVTTNVVDLVDALALAGMLVRNDMDAVADDFAGGRRRGGTVALTAAGVVATRRLLKDAGYDVPTAGRFADGTATELLAGTDVGDFATLWGELEAWRRRRDRAEAARQFGNAARELDDPALRNLALAVLADIGGADAEREVRNLTTDPSVRGFALCWLVDQGLEGPQALYDADDPGPFVDVLAHRLVTAGSEAMVDTLALVGSHQAQIALLGKLWRSPSTATETVLGALGETHPVKVVAKAARKAMFQRRSWSIR